MQSAGGVVKQETIDFVRTGHDASGMHSTSIILTLEALEVDRGPVVAAILVLCFVKVPRRGYPTSWRLFDEPDQGLFTPSRPPNLNHGKASTDNNK